MSDRRWRGVGLWGGKDRLATIRHGREQSAISWGLRHYPLTCGCHWSHPVCSSLRNRAGGHHLRHRDGARSKARRHQPLSHSRWRLFPSTRQWRPLQSSILRLASAFSAFRSCWPLPPSICDARWGWLPIRGLDCRSPFLHLMRHNDQTRRRIDCSNHSFRNSLCQHTPNTSSIWWQVKWNHRKLIRKASSGNKRVMKIYPKKYPQNHKEFLRFKLRTHRVNTAKVSRRIPTVIKKYRRMPTDSRENQQPS